MTSKEFQKLCTLTDRESYGPVATHLWIAPEKIRLLHAALGIGGESGEVLELIKKHIFYGTSLDAEKAKEECGDVLWYMAVLLNSINSSFEEVMEKNHEKLSKRFKSGKFTPKQAIKRADKKTSK